MDPLIILGCFLSYFLPIILLFVWARFLKSKHQVVMGIANLLYAVVATRLVFYRLLRIGPYQDIGLLLGHIEMFQEYPLVSFSISLMVVSVALGAAWIFAGFTGGLEFMSRTNVGYFTVRVEGVPLWKSFASRLIEVIGHPLVVYPAIFVISAFSDLHLVGYLLFEIRYLMILAFGKAF